MLTQVHIQNFKSYGKQTLHLAPLTLLVGANAAGKGNAVEAFRLLCWLGQGQRLSVLRHWMDSPTPIVRGHIDQLVHLGSPTFTLGCSTDDGQWNHFEVEIAVRDDGLHIVNEAVTTHATTRAGTRAKDSAALYKIQRATPGAVGEVEVAYNNFARGRKPRISCTDQMVVMSQLASPARLAAGNKDAQRTLPAQAKKFHDLFAGVLFFHPMPSLMRGDSHPSNTLHGGCSNLAGVLHALCKRKATKRAIMAFLQALPEQGVKDIRFFENHRGKVSLELVEGFGGRERAWPADLLPDGTLQTLAIAAALFSAPPGATLVMEGLEHGIYPAVFGQLLPAMHAQAQKRGLRLLLTTHSAALMNALPARAFRDVVFCYRSPDTGDSQLVRLQEMEDYVGIVVRGSLGSVVAEGYVDRCAKYPKTSQQRLQEARELLTAMQGGEG